MDVMATILIVVGATIMVYNIFRYANFLRNSQEIFSSSNKTERVIATIGLILLVFFLLGYLYVGFFVPPNMLVALILFFGSIYVTINESIMFRLFSSSMGKSERMTDVLTGILDAKSANLKGHSLHVQQLTMLLYDHLPKEMKSEVDRNDLELASLIHDIGELNQPVSVLDKPDKLTEDEWESIRRHPEDGASMLAGKPDFEEISDWIRCHHERVDGTGYNSIDKDQIPLASRMIAIADTYAAVTSERTYRQAKTHEGALEILHDAAGTQLDEQLVRIFLSIPKSELEKVKPQTTERRA